MTQATTILVDGKELEAVYVKTESSAVLLIKAEKGFLGCGYFSVETANKLGEAVAIVTGVKTFNDMLNAKVARVSERARALGIIEGLTGKEALKKMS